MPALTHALLPTHTHTRARARTHTHAQVCRQELAARRQAAYHADTPDVLSPFLWCATALHSRSHAFVAQSLYMCRYARAMLTQQRLDGAEGAPALTSSWPPDVGGLREAEAFPRALILYISTEAFFRAPPRPPPPPRQT